VCVFACVPTYVYVCVVLKWNDIVLLLQIFGWSEFSFINGYIKHVYLIVIKFSYSCWMYL
jgi:hypothetical protein